MHTPPFRYILMPPKYGYLLAMYSTVLYTCVRLWAPSTTVSGEGTTKLNYSCKLTLIWALVELQKLNSWQSWSGLFCKTAWSSTLTRYSVHFYRFVTHLPHRSPKAPKSEGSTELQLCDTAFIARGICIWVWERTAEEKREEEMGVWWRDGHIRTFVE